MPHTAWTLAREIALPHVDDPDWVAAGTPASPGASFSIPPINGQPARGIKLAWLLLDANDEAIAPAGTYSYRLTELVDPDQAAGQTYAAAAVVGAAFADQAAIPGQPGGQALYALRVYTVAGTPGGAVKARLFVKALL
jgi:hypothetical protein